MSLVIFILFFFELLYKKSLPQEILKLISFDLLYLNQ